MRLGSLTMSLSSLRTTLRTSPRSNRVVPVARTRRARPDSDCWVPAMKALLVAPMTTKKSPVPAATVAIAGSGSPSSARTGHQSGLSAASKGELKGVLGYETRPLVSVDFIGNPLSSIVDAAQTQVIGEDLLEVQSWYDNEWGFSNRMVDLLRHVSR